MDQELIWYAPIELISRTHQGNRTRKYAENIFLTHYYQSFSSFAYQSIHTRNVSLCVEVRLMLISQYTLPYCMFSCFRQGKLFVYKYFLDSLYCLESSVHHLIHFLRSCILLISTMFNIVLKFICCLLTAMLTAVS